MIENGIVVCDNCHLPYQDHGLDITLPDEQWQVIIGNDHGGGILCGRCIAILSEERILGAIAIRAYIETNPMQSDSLLIRSQRLAEAARWVINAEVEVKYFAEKELKEALDSYMGKCNYSVKENEEGLT